MRNKPILRFFVVGIVHAIMYVLGVVLFPLYFPLRRKRFFWWFLNYNEKDYVSNTYGDLGYRKRIKFNYATANRLGKLYRAFIWMALRNSHWNFRTLVMYPKKGKAYNLDVKINNTTPITNGTTFCNYEIKGVQYATYYVDGNKYFRYSFNKPFLGGRLNLHSGWAAYRWILKLRYFKS